MIVLGISGSLRAGSHNRRLLDAAGAALPDGVTLRIYDGLGGLPPYDQDVEDRAGDGAAVPPEVARLREAIGAADAVLIATPEYNASIPGVLKNALDWASRPFPDNSLRGRPVAVIGASTGLFGAVWAQAELRKVLETIGASVLDAELPVGQAGEAFDEHGLADPDQRAALAGVVADLVGAATGSAAPAPASGG